MNDPYTLEVTPTLYTGLYTLHALKQPGSDEHQRSSGSPSGRWVSEFDTWGCSGPGNCTLVHRQDTPGELNQERKGFRLRKGLSAFRVWRFGSTTLRVWGWGVPPLYSQSLMGIIVRGGGGGTILPIKDC